MERYQKESPITEQAKALHKNRPNGPQHLKAELSSENTDTEGKGSFVAEQFPSKDENEKSNEDSPAIRGI